MFITFLFVDLHSHFFPYFGVCKGKLKFKGHRIYTGGKETGRNYLFFFPPLEEISKCNIVSKGRKARNVCDDSASREQKGSVQN